MIKGSRVKILLLALMVAASHVALISHAAAHFQPALEQCELCVSQAQPLAAIPAAEVALFIADEPTVGDAPCRPAMRSATVARANRQRAPPVSTS
jgi:hypothetical protein